MSVTLFKNNLFVIISLSVLTSPPASLNVADRSRVLLGLLPSANVIYAPTNPYAVPVVLLIILLVLSKMLTLTLLPFNNCSPYFESNVAVIVVPAGFVLNSTGLVISKSNVALLILVFAYAKILFKTFCPIGSALLFEPVERALGTALPSYGCVSNSP